MRVANTVELKNKTNELLHIAMGGEPVIITLRGKPAAALTPLREDDLEGFISQYASKSARPFQGQPAPSYHYSTVPSSLGRVYVAYSDRGVCRLGLASTDAQFERGLRSRLKQDVVHDAQPPARLRRMLHQALSEGQPFPGPVDLTLVGPFERRVLDQLRQIPRGEVRTYLDIAKRLGYPGAVRAVGNACARNPIPLLIPCHRVIRSDGGLGGYSLRGGVSLKRRLLNDEGADMPLFRAST